MAIFTGRARKNRANASTSLVAHSAVPAEFHAHSMHVPSYTMTNEHGQRAVLVGGVLQFELLPDGDHAHMRDNAPKKRSRKKAVPIGPETSRLLADVSHRPSIGPETSRLLAAVSHRPSTGLGTAAAKRRRKKADTHAAISKLLEFDASAIRENASFTLDQDFGSGTADSYMRGGKGDTFMLGEFYHRLNRLYPGNTPIPIPPQLRVHLKHDVETQTFIFADFAVRKIAPIALRAAGLATAAAELERLKPITNKKTAADAAAAAAAAAAIAAAVAAAHFAVYEGFDANVAHETANAAANAAELDPDATWAAVNEMLKAL